MGGHQVVAEGAAAAAAAPERSVAAAAAGRVGYNELKGAFLAEVKAILKPPPDAPPNHQASINDEIRVRHDVPLVDMIRQKRVGARSAR